MLRLNFNPKVHALSHCFTPSSSHTKYNSPSCVSCIPGSHWRIFQTTAWIPMELGKVRAVTDFFFGWFSHGPKTKDASLSLKTWRFCPTLPVAFLFVGVDFLGSFFPTCRRIRKLIKQMWRGMNGTDGQRPREKSHPVRILVVFGPWEICQRLFFFVPRSRGLARGNNEYYSLLSQSPSWATVRYACPHQPPLVPHYPNPVRPKYVDPLCLTCYTFLNSYLFRWYYA
jgi:hypothetical protein